MISNTFYWINFQVQNHSAVIQVYNSEYPDLANSFHSNFLSLYLFLSTDDLSNQVNGF